MHISDSVIGRYDDAVSELKLSIKLAGHSTETLAALGMAYAEPIFDGLRNTPRFAHLMRRVGWNV